MKSPTKVLFTAGLGAVAMYYLDPAQGRRRRDLARDRIEYGRDRLEKASHTARAVGHEVGTRADSTIHQLRAVGHDVGERAGGAWEHARAVGHEVGERAARLTHGLKIVGRDTGHRTAGVVSSLGSLFNGRHSRRRSASSPLKLLGVPVMWLFVAGIGASVMYLFDPSQGIYRRARLRNRLPRQRTTGDSGREAANDNSSAEPVQAGPRQRARDASGVGNQERPLPG